MGTILFPGGAAFRTWAPFATQVFVAGDFNGWDSTANPLTSEGNGYWYGEVNGVHIRDQYKLMILNDG
ncbi:MAG: 1,4-alpha-glucan branching protein, partial [Chloroflexi bacterium]|nr:1,4-alpha-glucan branching protein [Chloroflexota bacterium]